MIEVNIHFELSEIDSYEMIPEGAKQKAFELVADEYMLLQRELLERGVTADGRPMKPYTEAYKDKKQRAGRMGEGYWLTLTGKMLRSQSVLVKHSGKVSTTLVVGFKGTRKGSQIETSEKGAKARFLKRTSRSQRGGYNRNLADRRRRAVNRASRSQRAGAGRAFDQAMSVVNAKGSVSNSIMAEANDKLRPFVGVSQANLDRLFNTYVGIIEAAGAKEKGRKATRAAFVSRFRKRR
jgi:hypothetical protein